MNKLILFVLTAAAVFSGNAAERQPDETLFRGSGFQCRIFDQYRRNSGIMKLTIGEKTLIAGSRVYAAAKSADGKEIALGEQSDPNFRWENNILTNEKFLVPLKVKKENAEKYAKISHKIAFEQNRIIIGITVSILKDFTLTKTWRTYTESLSIVTTSVIGMRISGTTLNGMPVLGVVPRKFERRKWGVGMYVKELELTDSEQFTMKVSADQDCKLKFNHYGGKFIDLSILPNIRQTELEQKAGTEIRFGCNIEFKKPE